MRRRDKQAVCLLVIIIAILSFLFTNIRGLGYYIEIVIFIGIHYIITMGLCLLMGFAGQISLGHAAFYGLGAYFSGVLTTQFGLSPL